MPLQSSGQIALSQVNAELNRSASQQIEMNESPVRTLAQRPSGQIAMSDFYGKSNCTAYGTYASQYCSGYTLYYRYHNGSCGFYDQAAQFNSPTCGYCYPYGTYYSQYCSGCTLYYQYWNGSCGLYDQVYEYNSQTCGCCPPYGEYASEYCSGTSLYYIYHNGGCGYYHGLVDSCHVGCGCGPADPCTGCAGPGYVDGSAYVYVCGSCGFGGWGCSGYYTSDSNWGNIAVQQGLISPGGCTYVSLNEVGCGSYFSACDQNCVYTASYPGWCAVTCC